MAFVRKKKVGKYEYYYLVENAREAGKVKQKTLLYLGKYPSVQAKVDGLKEAIKTRQGVIF